MIEGTGRKSNVAGLVLLIFTTLLLGALLVPTSIYAVRVATDDIGKVTDKETIKYVTIGERRHVILYDPRSRITCVSEIPNATERYQWVCSK